MTDLPQPTAGHDPSAPEEQPLVEGEQTKAPADTSLPTAAHLGTMLRQARTKQGADITEMATKTRIRDTYLRALEEGKVDKLPGPTFVTGFLRIYAKNLTFADREAVERYIASEDAREAQLQTDLFPAPTISRHRPSVMLVSAGVLGLLGLFFVYETYFAIEFTPFSPPELPHTPPRSARTAASTGEGHAPSSTPPHSERLQAVDEHANTLQDMPSPLDASKRVAHPAEPDHPPPPLDASKRVAHPAEPDHPPPPPVQEKSHLMAWLSQSLDRAGSRQENRYNPTSLSMPEASAPEEQPIPEKSTPEKSTPEKSTPEKSTPEKSTPEQPEPERLAPEKSTPEQPEPERLAPEKSTPEQPEPEESTPEESTPEESTPEESTRFFRDTPSMTEPTGADTRTPASGADTFIGLPADRPIEIPTAIWTPASTGAPHALRANVPPAEALGAMQPHVPIEPPPVDSSSHLAEEAHTHHMTPPSPTDASTVTTPTVHDGDRDQAPEARIVTRYPETIRSDEDLRPESPRAVSLLADKLVWVQIQDGEGQILKDMVMQPGQLFRIPPGGRFFVTLGNADDIRLRVGARFIPLDRLSEAEMDGLDLDPAALLQRIHR